MLEKIGTAGFETISKADQTVLRLLDAILVTEPEPIIYEIGVGVGATTLPVARKLGGAGKLILFSRVKDVLEISADLRDLGFENVVDSFGSGSQTFSGYHFELARGFVAGNLPEFDLASIDGGHVFHLDAPAACVLKELCKPGGYMVFDDWSWSIGTSPTLNPAVRAATAQEFDTAQIETSHVELVCKVVMDTDPRFEFLGLEADSAVYRRRKT